MDDVGRGATHDHPVGRGVDAHALVVLDLGDRRVDHVGDAELLEAGGATRRTTEDHEALGRTTHAGGEVVEAEQLLEALRVLFVLLQRLDQGQLLVDEGVPGIGAVVGVGPGGGVADGGGLGVVNGVATATSGNDAPGVAAGAATSRLPDERSNNKNRDDANAQRGTPAAGTRSMISSCFGSSPRNAISAGISASPIELDAPNADVRPHYSAARRRRSERFR